MDQSTNTAPLACSLNDADFKQRRAFAREKLIPQIKGFERLNNALEFRFTPSAELKTDLQTFVHLEEQCCGFLSFTILESDSADQTQAALRIEGPAGAAATLDMFAKLSQRA